ncbi:hypothetical protein L195_g046786, partial [Trifolium pratense]
VVKVNMIMTNYTMPGVAGVVQACSCYVNSPCRMRFVVGALVLRESHLFGHVLFPVIRVLSWGGKNNTMDTLRSQTSTTVEVQHCHC